MRPWQIAGAALAAALVGGCGAGSAFDIALHPSSPDTESYSTDTAKAVAQAEGGYQVDADPTSYSTDTAGAVAQAEGAHQVDADPSSAPVSSSVKAPKRGDILGRWDGEIETPKGGKDDPMDKMGMAMAQMMLGSLSLELRQDSTFSLNVMIPIEGTYTRSGNTLTLTPKTIAGMTPAEAAKMGAARGKATPDTKPMRGTIAADGSSITLTSDGEKGGALKFKRAAPEKPVVPTVRPDEKPFVGKWKGELDLRPSPGASQEEQEKAAMAARMLKDSLELTLRADNTFRMRMMMELEGKWSVKSGQVVLKIDGIAGMGPATSSKSEPLELVIGEGGRVLTASKKEGGSTESLTFRRL